MIVDFILGCSLLLSCRRVRTVELGLSMLEGTRHMERYMDEAWRNFKIWAGLLTTLIILVLVEKFVPAVYQTVHIALILNNFNQLINTMQFYAAFKILRGVEILMAIGTGRKVISSQAFQEQSESIPANMLMRQSEQGSEMKIEPLSEV